MALWTVLQLESVQTYFAKQATTFLSKELNTKVSIERVKFRLLKNLDFQEIYIEDLAGDTMLSIASLNLDLLDLSFSEKHFDFSAILIDPVVNIHRHQEDSVFNYQFMIDYFKSDQESEIFRSIRL